MKPYVVTPHLKRLVKTVQMRGHNICLNAELTKIIPNYHQILPYLDLWFLLSKIESEVTTHISIKSRPQTYFFGVRHT